MSDQVVMETIPGCDIPGCENKAGYDAKTRQGPWAYLCESHYQSHGVGRLGTGWGQRLVTAQEAVDAELPGYQAFLEERGLDPSDWAIEQYEAWKASQADQLNRQGGEA